MGRRVILSEAGLIEFTKTIEAYKKSYRNRFKSKLDQTTMASDFGVTPSTLRKILRRRPTYPKSISSVYAVLFQTTTGIPASYLEAIPDDPRPPRAPDPDEDSIEGTASTDSALGLISPSVPSLDPHFTGHQGIDMLEKIHRTLQASQAVALAGMPGIGKTQTAQAYVYRYHREYKGIYWVVAEDLEALNSGLAGLAEQLTPPVPIQKSQEETLRDVRNWFDNHHSGWLLILDNADDLDQVAPFFPRHHNGRLLLTTRAQATGRIATRLEIPKLNWEDGATLLLRRAGKIGPHETLREAEREDQEKALAVSLEMDGLPIYLKQAGAYIETARSTVAEYLHLYQTYWVLCERLLPHWRRCVEHINAFDICTAEAAHLLDKTASYLEQQSLFPESEQLCVRSLRIKEQVYGLEDLETANGYNNVAALYTHRRYYFGAEPLYLHALKIRETKLDSKDPAIGEVQNNLAILYTEQERYDEAEPRYERALEIRQQGESAELERTLNGMAVMKQKQDKYEEALDLYQRALSVGEARLGKENPEIALFLINPAVLYNKLGRYDEARPLLERALAILNDPSKSKPMNPHRAGALWKMAIVQWKQGELQKAEAGFQEGRRIFEAVLGENDPVTQRLVQEYNEFLENTR